MTFSRHRITILLFAVLAAQLLWAALQGTPWSKAAFAQPQPAMCRTVYQTIITLQDPLYGVPTVWDAVYKKKGKMAHVYSGVPMDDGTITVTGRTLSKADFTPLETFLANINRRGRVLKEASFSARQGEKPVRMIRLDDYFIVAANVTGGDRNSEQHVRISWYDKEFQLVREHIEKNSHFNYRVNNLRPTYEKDGFIAVISSHSRADHANHHGRLVSYTLDGRVRWERSYRVGIPNMLHDVRAINTDEYLALGRIRMDGGRMAGWALKIGHDGAVLWQRTFPRGTFSVLKAGAIPQDISNPDAVNYLLTGQSSPTDGGPEAAWLLALNGLGKTLWERFFRHPDYNLSGEWVAAHTDDRILLGLSADVRTQQGQQQETGKGRDIYSHVKLVTMTPNGILLNHESYLKGRGMRAVDFVQALGGGWNGERLVFGITERDPDAGADEERGSFMSYYLRAFKERVNMDGEDKKPEGDTAAGNGESDGKIVQEGWSFVATAPGPFDNPCKKSSPDNRYR